MEAAAAKARRRAEAREQRRVLSALRRAERQAARAREGEEDDSWIRPRFLVEIPQVDVIVGSELTYTPANVYNLISVMKRHLAPGGVFYEIVSDDRDGMALFLQEIVKEGFEYSAVVVPDKYLGNYGTAQNPETYKFYTVKRKDEPNEFPIRGVDF